MAALHDETRDFKRLKCTATNRDMISLDSLPIETIEEILIRIPAQDIVDTTMFVCRKWFQLTHTKSFILANLHHSTPGLLIRTLLNKTSYFIYLTQAAQIVISKLKYYIRHTNWSSCNGLLLESLPDDNNQLMITNPITTQHFHLPPFTIPLTEQPHSKSAIAYVASRMEYKVVRTYSLGSLRELCTPQTQFVCAILAVGVDNSWRLVDTQHLSVSTCQLFRRSPLVTGGFVHWVDDVHITPCLRFNKNYVLTLNMETEIITRYNVPLFNGGNYYYRYLPSSGNNLSLLIRRGSLKWDVWEMEPESGKWTGLLCNIDLVDHKDLFNHLLYDREEEGCNELGAGDSLDCKLVPVGWLKYQEVIIFIVYRPPTDNRFKQTRLRVVYNLQTRDITLFSLDCCFIPQSAHRNSLIGC